MTTIKKSGKTMIVTIPAPPNSGNSLRSRSIERQRKDGAGTTTSTKWKLTRTMIVVIAVCSVVNTWFYLTLVHNNDNEITAATTRLHHQQAGHHHAMERSTTTSNNAGTGGKDSSSSSAALSTLTCRTDGSLFEDEREDDENMVYWRDIPSDRRYVSPYRRQRQRQQKRSNERAGQQKRGYITFEPDVLGGTGGNNIRMALETVLGLAFGTGRTLVLPPEKILRIVDDSEYKLWNEPFGLSDVFPIRPLLFKTTERYEGLDVITTTEFLSTVAMAGNMTDKTTGQVTFPPGNRTDWNGANASEYMALKNWLRSATVTPAWDPDACMVAFPASEDYRAGFKRLGGTKDRIVRGNLFKEGPMDAPIRVNARSGERMRETITRQRTLCPYDALLRNEPVLHFADHHPHGNNGNGNDNARISILSHFYAFLFFEDWREDLWLKRFVRDRLRYSDEIQCAAARVVNSMREYSRNVKKDGDNQGGQFDALHVRRGEYVKSFNKDLSAEGLYEQTKYILKPGAVIFVATDERRENRAFFDPLRKYYFIRFLDDFKKELRGVNPNYYPMIEHLVAARGEDFFGCWHSRVSGYISRIRGYHSIKDRELGNGDKGLLPNSYYYVPQENKYVMHKYQPLRQPFFDREFPTAWRGIDYGIGKLPRKCSGTSSAGQFFLSAGGLFTSSFC